MIIKIIINLNEYYFSGSGIRKSKEQIDIYLRNFKSEFTFFKIDGKYQHHLTDNIVEILEKIEIEREEIYNISNSSLNN